MLVYCPKCKDGFNGVIYKYSTNHYYSICPTCKTKIFVKANSKY